MKSLTPSGFESPTSLATIYEGLPPPYSNGQTEPSELSSHEDLNNETCSSIDTHHDNLSTSSGSISSDTSTVRVRTKGNDLKSGFPYHSRLFDLHVRPDDWQRFNDQVTNATRFTSSDYAKMWAAAGSVALTGSLLMTAWVAGYVLRCIYDEGPH
jgi:hypothetical protein